MKEIREFYEMIEERKKNVFDGKSDCAGTALYLVGEIDEDKAVVNPEKYLSRLEKTGSPEIGYLIDWEDEKNNSYHLAVVANKEPLTLLTRNGSKAKFEEWQSFKETDYIYDELISDFGIIKKRNNFYVPSKLQKIIDMEESN